MADVVQIPIWSGERVVAQAIVDADDAVLVLPYRWWIDRLRRQAVCTYLPGRTAEARDLRRRYGRTNVSLGRLLLGLERNSGQRVVHINGDPLDNRRGNLRAAGRYEAPVEGEVGVKRYVFPSGRVRFKAYTKYQGVKLHIGYYNTAEEAIAARAEYRKHLTA